MARVEIPAPADVVMDSLGNVLSGRSVTLKRAGTATDVTHFSALTAGTSTTGGLVTYTDGTIRDVSGNRRYIEDGYAVDITVAGITRRLEPYGVTSKLIQPLNLRDAAYAADNTGVADVSTIVNTAWADGRPVYAPKGRYLLSSKLVPTSNSIMLADGRGKTIFDASAVAADSDGSYRAIAPAGSVGTLTLLTRDALKGEMQVDVASSSGITAGDYVQLSTTGPRGVLNGAITTGTTSIVVTVTTGCAAFSARGYLIIGSERIAYSSVGVVGNQATFTVRSTPAGRGALGTTAAAGSNGATVFEMHSGKYYHWRSRAMDLGETKRVNRVSGNTLYFDTPIYDDYAVANVAAVREVTMVTGIQLHDFDVEMNPAIQAKNEYAIDMQRCSDFTIDNVGTHYASMLGIRLDGCVGGDIRGSVSHGKAGSDVPNTHDFYAIGLVNACHDITINGARADRCFKILTTFSNTIGSSVNTYAGRPRFVSASDIVLDNAGVGFFSRHPGIELHGSGEYITVQGFACHGVDSLVSIQSGINIRVSNGTGSGWYRAGIVMSGIHEAHNIEVSHVNVGGRTFGWGRTTLTVDSGTGTGNLAVTSTADFLDDTASTVGALLKVVSAAGTEIIKYTGVSGNSFTGIARAQENTTALNHTAVSAVVTAYGSAAACPVDLDFTDCIWAQRAYNQPVTALTVDPGAAGTTITVTDTTGFPTASGTDPKQAIIEGEDSTRNFEPEVITYTGQTGTTLTGVTRGGEGSKATAHTVGTFCMPYECPVTQVKFSDIMGEQEHVYYGLVSRGFLAARGLSFQGIQITQTGDRRSTTDACRIETHNASLKGCEFTNFPYGFRLAGNSITVAGDCKVELPFQDPNGGYFATIDGFDCQLANNRAKQVYQGVVLSSTLLRPVITNNRFRVPFSTRLITGSVDSTLISNGNIPLLDSGQDMALTAAATISPVPGFGYWRVTGATGITAISPWHPECGDLTLKFDSNPVLTTGAALKLAGAANFSATADDLLTLRCDATNWREKARSVN